MNIEKIKIQIKEDLNSYKKEELIKLYKTSKIVSILLTIIFNIIAFILVIKGLFFVGLFSLLVSYIFAQTIKIYNYKIYYIEEL